MSSKYHPDFEAALAAKRQLATLDRLLSDNQLDRHLKNWGVTNKLTLGAALLRCVDVARAIDRQLEVLEPYIYRGRIQSVIKQLRNDAEGLLNTWSELGLAMRLIEDGWNVEIGSVFHGKKDVDVRAERDGDVRFVDVINLAPSPLTESPDVFYPMPGSRPVDSRLRAKVQEKSVSKFQAARAAGWNGSTWVAMNIARDDGLLVEATFRHAFTQQDWQADLATELRRDAPSLGGVFYFILGVPPHMVAAAPFRWLPLG